MHNGQWTQGGKGHQCGSGLKNQEAGKIQKKIKKITWPQGKELKQKHEPDLPRIEHGQKHRQKQQWTNKDQESRGPFVHNGRGSQLRRIKGRAAGEAQVMHILEQDQWPEEDKVRLQNKTWRARHWKLIHYIERRPNSQITVDQSEDFDTSEQRMEKKGLLWLQW